MQLISSFFFKKSGLTIVLIIQMELSKKALTQKYIVSLHSYIVHNYRRASSLYVNANGKWNCTFSFQLSIPPYLLRYSVASS